MNCPQCDAESPQGMRFCGQCGASLATVARQPELRQLTVLFCDLVGSTELAERLDPEELREVTGRYHAVCGRVIERYEGHVAQYLGDGLLVYFGHPMAHEDDAQRAIRTGLGILRELEELAPRITRSHGVGLAARVGIHTGPVVIGEVGSGSHRENLALGRAPNLAARVQDLAAPGTLLVTEATRALAVGHFDFEPKGEHEVRGLSDPVALYGVAGAPEATSPQERLRSRGFTALTGRTEELEALVDRWNRATSVGLTAALVSGEAGIGKSRIVDALRRRVHDDVALVLECSSSPYHQNSALFPIISLIERQLGASSQSEADDRLRSLERSLERSGILSPETRAVMAELLSIPLPDELRGPALPAHVQRELMLETLRSWLFALAERGPVLWIFEDLHWTDSTTLEFLGSLLERPVDVPILTVLTHRPEFASPWSENGTVASLELRRLEPSSTRAMIEHVTRGKALPAEVMSRVIERADGVPLFIEEVTKAVLEAGVLREREDRYELAGPLPEDLIPATVQGSLNARLDRLGDAKSIAQIAATIGRTFRYDVLEKVADVDEHVLREGLARLVDTELVFRAEDEAEESYLFKHALIQDAAYHSLLKKARRTLHLRIGDALSDAPGIAGTQPDLLAHHYTAAGDGKRAVPLWLDAVRRAAGKAANYEVAGHCRRGLEAVELLVEDERIEPEIEFVMAIIPALQTTIGWSSGELTKYYDRSEELAEIVGDPMQRFRVVLQTFASRFTEGHCRDALPLAQQLPPIAESLGHAAPLYLGYCCLMVALTYEGRFKEALEAGTRAMKHVNDESDPVIMQAGGMSGRSYPHTYLAEIYWALGYPDRALAESDTSIANARSIEHLASLAHAVGDSTHFLPHYGDPDAVLDRVEEALRIEEEQRSTWWGPFTGVYKGWALTVRGEHDEGIELMRRSLQRYLASGSGICQSHMRACLATGLMRAHRWDEAIQVLAEARAVVDAIGERYFEAELYRLDAEARIQRAIHTDSSTPELERAEASIGRALERARATEAKSHELRALMSLCRLERLRGDPAEARAALQEVYDGFTEGFETRDLIEARTLLDDLER